MAIVLVASGHYVKGNPTMDSRGAKISKVFPSRALEKIIIRLPDGMRDRLAEAAAANNRSANAEAVSRLEKSFDSFDLEQSLRWLAKMGIRLMRPDGTYFTEEETMAELLDVPISSLQEGRDKRFGEQLERGFRRLEGVIDGLDKRLKRLEKALLG